MVRGVKPWDIFYIENGIGSKAKFFVALYPKRVQEHAHTTIVWYGFYINSGPQRLDRLKQCDVPMSAGAYGFLNYDSFINVGEADCHYEGSLTERRGYIKKGDKVKVLDAAEVCPVLEEKHKAQIQQLREVGSPT